LQEKGCRALDLKEARTDLKALVRKGQRALKLGRGKTKPKVLSCKEMQRSCIYKIE